MATTTTKLPRAHLEAYFDAFTRHYLRDESTNAVDVEVLSPNLGDQVAENAAHLVGVSYDPRTNAFELLLESGDHRVYEPQDVWVVEERNGFVSAIEVVRKDGVKDVIRIRRLGVQRVEDRAPSAARTESRTA